ncbi:16S rRNA (uracil1498-N3)-methyltransferase [Stella humosa]|uniref:Ribosomal RNA small subunit methyltransferase E n=1 Tax=Stella humosa TaxID=94 RepID=A0A3N1LK33_9PROT|nr:16S rRNA (uracil(1498)-N(3))-methyltransferase [Stella humosa]ROP91099.1 16S rRNA (uracil1498-N3)-methyltransferase [Stella humosa]BBK34550.1 ribosomal RNA small subunit methyltransferase E [Stella humosa]
MTDQPRVQTRLHVAADLGPEAVVGLDEGQAHLVRSVLRLEPGDHVALFNGRDGEWLARLDGIGKGWASAALVRQLRPQVAEPDLWLAFAPIKRARLDFLAEKATELGVSVLWPVFTRHTAVERVNDERLRANAREAAEQTGRLSIPEVRPPVDLMAMLGAWQTDRRILLGDESGTAPPVAEVLGQCDHDGPWAVLTGPEGGFARAELDRLRELPFVSPASLGPRVLRADTAAIAALAVLQALRGDWRHGRPRFPSSG